MNISNGNNNITIFRTKFNNDIPLDISSFTDKNPIWHAVDAGREYHSFPGLKFAPIDQPREDPPSDDYLLIWAEIIVNKTYHISGFVVVIQHHSFDNIKHTTKFWYEVSMIYYWNNIKKMYNQIRIGNSLNNKENSQQEIVREIFYEIHEINDSIIKKYDFLYPVLHELNNKKNGIIY